jgi:hypothetical protein
MVRLKFEGMSSGQSIVVGPSEAFRVAGNYLRRLPANEVIAEYSRHQWHVQGGHYSRYDAVDRCYIYFADFEGVRTGPFGPFDTMHVADGTMYTADSLFAKFVDETLLWHSFELENYWPNLIIIGA